VLKLGLGAEAEWLKLGARWVLKLGVA